MACCIPGGRPGKEATGVFRVGRPEKQQLLLQSLLARDSPQRLLDQHKANGFWAAADQRALSPPLGAGRASRSLCPPWLLHRASRGRLAPAESHQAINPVRLLSQIAWQLPLFSRPCSIWNLRRPGQKLPASLLSLLAGPGRAGPRTKRSSQREQGDCWEALQFAGMGQTRPASSREEQWVPREHLAGCQGQPLPLLHPRSQENPCPASRHRHR